LSDTHAHLSAPLIPPGPHSFRYVPSTNQQNRGYGHLTPLPFSKTSHRPAGSLARCRTNDKALPVHILSGVTERFPEKSQLRAHAAVPKSKGFYPVDPRAHPHSRGNARGMTRRQFHPPTYGMSSYLLENPRAGARVPPLPHY